ncbi:hypothetical protein ENSA5_45370 [Enhygromyxa salina]|uniref:PIN domain-containing protein n=1 Tax=Enhygromyxa salina TaxID=215803 RepID=A0A2S9XJP8_9BACT|nr:PIN domain-containing protein [Enhygromyxa salina]PRP93094.1 hypothetical protein ENSA5_45370 [Enhygromyxa salina]
MTSNTPQSNDGEIDIALLPRKCLIDTNIVIRALGERTDRDSVLCEKFFRAMFRAEGHSMYVAAPTLAEVLRGNPNTRIPSTPSIVHVPFDRRAAEIIGRDLPIRVLKLERENHAVPISYLKYDAMICACAKLAQVDCILALDGDFWKLAPHVEIPVKYPRDFLAAQLSLVGSDED